MIIYVTSVTETRATLVILAGLWVTCVSSATEVRHLCQACAYCDKQDLDVLCDKCTRGANVVTIQCVLLVANRIWVCYVTSVTEVQPLRQLRVCNF